MINDIKLTPEKIIKVVNEQLRAHTIAQARKQGSPRTLIVLPVRISAKGQDNQIITARVMFDTGATGEFMTEECANKLGGQITEGNFGAVEEAFGQKTKLNRKMERVKLRFNGVNRRSAVDEEVTKEGDFHVVPKLHPDYDMIVGISFTEEAGAIIDLGKRPREVTFRQENGHEVVVKDVLNEQQEEARGLPEKEVVRSLVEELRREARFRRQVGLTVHQFNQMKNASDQQPLLALKASVEVPDLVMSYEAMCKLKKAEKRLPEAKRSKYWTVYCRETEEKAAQAEAKEATEAKEAKGGPYAHSGGSKGVTINALATEASPSADEVERQKLADEIVKEWEGRIMPADLPAGLPPKRDSPQMTIQIKENTNPVAAYARRDTFQHTAESKKMLNELLEKGFIRPSQSPWGSPMFLVSKPDGTSRMVIDYRALNTATIRNRYPLPRVDELFDKLQGAKYFSKIDLRSGYYQIQMAEEDVQKTAFTSRHGHYEWLVMPMGLTNAPAVFMALMENIFREELDTYVNCFLDDVMIFSKTLEEHRIHVNNVFKKLEEKKLYVKKSKCEFVKTEVEFLGHVVGRDGVKMVEDKVRAVREWKTPECQKEVEQFLGLAGYYRRFIKDFSKIAAPLSELTGTLGKRRKKEEAKGKRERPQVKQFVWGDAQQEAFEALKEAVCTAPVLALPDPNKIFKMQVDASGYATGAVIMQEFEGHWRPIAFLSRRMDKAECNYSVRDQEWLAIIRAMQAWPHYLKGPLGFILESDHQSLRTIQRKDIENGRQARWQQIMGEHDFVIQYIQGEKNVVADALSRGAIGKPADEDQRWSDEEEEEEEEQDNALSHQIKVALEVPVPTILIKEAARLDQEYQSLLELSKEELAKLSLINQGGMLHKERERGGPVTVIPNNQALRTRVMQLAHDTIDGAHAGSDLTTAWLKQRLWWKYMERDVGNYIKGCNLCQRNKPDTRGRQGLPQSIVLTNQPWECIGMDFIGPFPKTPRGNDFVLVVIDKVSKYVYYIPTTLKVTSQEVLQLLERYVFSERGLPKFIISDRDSRFTSRFWRDSMKALGVEQKMSTAFHPQTDGQTEQANHTLIKALRSTIDSRQTDWDIRLPYLQGATNDHKSSATGYSPFEFNNGRLRRSQSSVALEELGVSERRSYPGAAKWIKRRDEMIKEAEAAQAKAHQKQRADAQQGHRPVEIKVGDQVLLSRQNLKSDETKQNRRKKLGPLYYGPFEVLAMDHSNTATVRLPMTWKIHNKFNVKYLKLYTDGRIAFPDRIVLDDHPGPVEVTDDPEAGGPIQIQKNDPEYEVECIVGDRIYRGQQQYLVKWTGWEEEQNSWKSAEELDNCQESIDDYKKMQLGASVARIEQLEGQLRSARGVVAKQEADLQASVAKVAIRKVAPGKAIKRSAEQQQRAASRAQRLAEEVRQYNLDQVKKNVPLDDPAQLPRTRVNKNGEIKLPTQRCTSGAKNGQQCRNRTQYGDRCWSHLLKEDCLKIGRSTIPRAGKGLYAQRDFKKGETVARYTGDLVHNDERYDKNRYFSAYLLELTGAISIDAARTNTAVGRMVNDARGTNKKNNCSLSCHHATRTATLKASRNIKKGEELFTAYGAAYWKGVLANKLGGKAKKKVIRKNKIIDLTNFILSQLGRVGDHQTRLSLNK